MPKVSMNPHCGNPYNQEFLQPSKYPRTGKRGAPQAFPRRLYEILENESPDIVSWERNGEGFVINDMQSFINKTLVKYFRHNNYTSFHRQCNLYGFKKITRGPNVGMYVHDFFKRDRYEDLANIRRPKLYVPSKNRGELGDNYSKSVETKQSFKRNDEMSDEQSIQEGHYHCIVPSQPPKPRRLVSNASTNIDEWDDIQNLGNHQTHVPVSNHLDLFSQGDLSSNIGLHNRTSDSSSGQIRLDGMNCKRSNMQQNQSHRLYEDLSKKPISSSPNGFNGQRLNILTSNPSFNTGDLRVQDHQGNDWYRRRHTSVISPEPSNDSNKGFLPAFVSYCGEGETNLASIHQKTENGDFIDALFENLPFIDDGYSTDYLADSQHESLQALVNMHQMNMCPNMFQSHQNMNQEPYWEKPAIPQNSSHRSDIYLHTPAEALYLRLQQQNQLQLQALQGLNSVPCKLYQQPDALPQTQQIAPSGPYQPDIINSYIDQGAAFFIGNELQQLYWYQRMQADELRKGAASSLKRTSPDLSQTESRMQQEVRLLQERIYLLHHHVELNHPCNDENTNQTICYLRDAQNKHEMRMSEDQFEANSL